MIIDYVDGKLIRRCPVCGAQSEVEAPSSPPQPVPEHDGKLAAIPLPPCPSCGTVAFLNPELPTASEDMEIADFIPGDEWRQRTIVRALVSALKARKPLPAKVPPIPKRVNRDGSK